MQTPARERECPSRKRNLKLLDPTARAEAVLQDRAMLLIMIKTVKPWKAQTQKFQIKELYFYSILDKFCKR